MTILRQRLERALRLRNRRPKTIAAYVYCLRNLAGHYGLSPDQLDSRQVCDFLDSLMLRGLSSSTQHQHRAAFRFFYRYIVRRLDIAEAIPPIKVSQRLPEVVRVEQAARLFEGTSNLKHRTAFMLCYGTGMRVGELARLEVNHIDRIAGLIHVRDGKGGKDRVVPMSPALYRLLRDYWSVYRPVLPWMFEGRRSGKSHISLRALQGAFAKNMARAGLENRTGIHGLRHGFATRFLQLGGDVRTLQLILGHGSLDTTMRYMHVSGTMVKEAPSPIDELLNLASTKSLPGPEQDKTERR